MSAPEEFCLSRVMQMFALLLLLLLLLNHKARKYYWQIYLKTIPALFRVENYDHHGNYAVDQAI